MAEAERRLLTREARRALGQHVGRQGVDLLLLAALSERVVEFVGDVEMVLDDALVAPGDEDELFDARRPRFVDDVLQDRPVDDRQHLLGDRFGRGQEARAEAGDRQDRLADGFEHSSGAFPDDFSSAVAKKDSDALKSSH